VCRLAAFANAIREALYVIQSGSVFFHSIFMPAHEGAPLLMAMRAFPPKSSPDVMGGERARAAGQTGRVPLFRVPQGTGLLASTLCWRRQHKMRQKISFGGRLGRRPEEIIARAHVGIRRLFPDCFLPRSNSLCWSDEEKRS